MSYLETPDGVRLRLCDRGSGERTFVLVHGWKQSHRVFDPAIVRLAERHRVIAFDLRGMGESDKPNSRYDFDELADDVRFVLDALELDDVTLVGLSMGCTVSLSHLRSGAPRVGRLVLVNGPLRLTRAPDFAYGLEPERLDGYIENLEQNWPLNERPFAAESLLEPDSERVEWLVRIAQQTPLDIALRLVREQARLDLRSAVEDLEVPVLAAYSRHEPWWPPALADWIADHAPRGERVIFERSAHCTPFEEAERFCAVLEDFAARTATPPTSSERTREVR